MRKLILVLLLAMPVSAFAGHNADVKAELVQLSIQDSQCHEAHNDSTAEVRACQNSYYKALDKVLNREYSKLMSGYMDAETKIRFRQAQRDWITFKESNCKWESAQMLGGTGEAVIYLGCINSMTEKRIKAIINHFYFDVD